MSLTSSTARIAYTQSSVGQTFAVPFYFLAAADLGVIRTRAGVDTDLALNSGYTVSGAGTNPSTATITIIGGAASDTITIYRNADITQPSTYVSNDRFPASTQEQNMDRQTMMIQQLREEVKRSVRFPMSNAEAGIMPLASRANKRLGFDGNGAISFENPIAVTVATGNVVEVSSLSALRAVVVASLTTGRQARLSGYASANDGGGGLYTYDSSSAASDNNGTIIAPTSGSGRWLRVIDGPVWAEVFGAKGDGTTDDTDAIQAASDALCGVAPILFGPGTYMAEGLTFAAGVELIGIPGATVIKGATGAGAIMAVNPGTEGSTSPDDNTFGVHWSGIEVRGRSDLGFSEFVHNVILSAVSDVLIENCKFTSSRGDGIYLGCFTAATERHNERVTIRKCVFDGVNKENRNAITVTDCTQLTIEDCYFTRYTKSTMPGAIDVEPNPATYTRLRDLYILRNRFYDIGGNSGAIFVSIGTSQPNLTTKASNFVIQGNSFDSVFTPINVNQPWDAAATPFGLLIADNVFKVHTGNTISINGIRNQKVVRNTLMNGSLVYFAGDNEDVVFAQNIAQSCGLAFDNCANVKLVDNTFNNASSSAIVFLFGNAKTSSNVTIRGNTVTGGGWTALVEASGHTFGTTNVFDGNAYPTGLTNEFSWRGVHTVNVTAAFGTVNAGLTGFVDVTVPGAAVGDNVIVNRTDADNINGLITMNPASVISTNTVRIRVGNPTGSNIAVGNYDIRVTTMAPYIV